MVFGESTLILLHLESGIKIHFNALDALKGWKDEALPPVEVPAAAQWKFRRYMCLRLFFNTNAGQFFLSLSVSCFRTLMVNGH